jgi:transcriptional regulator with GAF, ATPase, and Fis domain
VIGTGRDHGALLRSLNSVLQVLWGDGAEVDALRASFAEAAVGFEAENALLLLLESAEPLRLRALQAHGPLTPEQVHACESGESVKGVSPSVIRSVVATGRPELIRDPRLHPAASRTTSLTGANYSVLCAPILDHAHQRVLAVIYFQKEGLAGTYDDADLAWIELYATALGRVFGLHLKERQRTRELTERLSNVDPPEDAPEILGDSSHTEELRRLLHEVYIPVLEASTPDPILILGERGTGKDLVARYLHAYGRRRKKPFVVVNCAEITEEMAAARFFGHKRGAFTGALNDEPGFFRAADGGTLFLDEVAELHPRAQASLLRVLESHAVVPVGQAQERPVDVAVVLATNRDPGSLVADGTMRADFHDRFRTQVIQLQPLRERPWDIHALLEHFRSHHERRMAKRTLGYTQDALRLLLSYSWPGNAREVARVCSLVVAHAPAGARLDAELLKRCYPEITTSAPNPRAAPILWEGTSMREALRAFQRELIQARLLRHDGDVRAARESLGLTKTTFQRYLRSLGIRAD